MLFSSGSADIVINATSEAFLVLPYFSLGTLHDYLVVRSFSKNYLDIKEILRLFSEICQGVKYLHNFSPEPLAHRDLKTANVCLSEGMVPVLMDLGNYFAYFNRNHIFSNGTVITFILAREGSWKPVTFH